MTQPSDRKKLRATVRFQVAYLARGRTGEAESGRPAALEGTGKIRNISRGGALIDEADQRLEPGAQIKLRFSFLEDSIPVEVPAEVIRETETGFAVEFKKLSHRTRAVLGMAIAKLRANEDEGQDDGDIPLLKS